MPLKTWLKKHKTSLTTNRISAPEENEAEREENDDNGSDEDDLLVETEGLVTVEMSFISASLHVIKESTLIWINNYDLHRVVY